MQQIPPSGSGKNRGGAGRGQRTTGKNGLTPVPDKHSRMFSTGNHATTDAVSQRAERGARILSDVKRALLFAFVLVVVGVVLAQFVRLL